MNIVTPQVSAYLDSLFHPRNQYLEELRKTAEQRRVPIILRDTEQLLTSLLQLKKPARILEIGTAVGYSAIFFATLCPDALITTLELSEQTAAIAQENIEKAGLSDRITIRLGDGRDTLLSMEQEGEAPFDLIFIDAAKGQYQVFWEHSKALWSRNVLVVSDNVLFKGMTASDDFVPDRRNKTIIRRMREYLSYITMSDEVETSVLAVGDGVAISTRKQKSEEPI